MEPRRASVLVKLSEGLDPEATELIDLELLAAGVAIPFY